MRLSLVPGIVCALLATVAPVVAINSDTEIDIGALVAAGERGELATELPEGYEQVAFNDQPVAPPVGKSGAGPAPGKSGKPVAPPQLRHGAVTPAAEGAVQLSFKVDYRIKEVPEAGPTDVAELEREKEYTFLFEIMSEEASPLSVVGFGGRFLNASTKEVLVNLTGDAIGPHIVKQGGTERFDRKVTILLPDGNYIFAPEIYIVLDEEVRVAPLRQQLLTLETPPVSFFNLAFIFSVLVLLGSVGAIGYSIFLVIIKPYLQKTSPTNLKKKGTKAQGVSSGAEWIPKGVQVPRSKKSA